MRSTPTPLLVAGLVLTVAVGLEPTVVVLAIVVVVVATTSSWRVRERRARHIDDTLRRLCGGRSSLRLRFLLLHHLATPWQHALPRRLLRLAAAF